MGVYSIVCPTCGRTDSWFSGSADQRCYDCINSNPKEKIVSEVKLKLEELKLSHITMGRLIKELEEYVIK